MTIVSVRCNDDCVCAASTSTWLVPVQCTLYDTSARTLSSHFIRLAVSLKHVRQVYHKPQCGPQSSTTTSVEQNRASVFSTIRVWHCGNRVLITVHDMEGALTRIAILSWDHSTESLLQYQDCRWPSSSFQEWWRSSRVSFHNVILKRAQKKASESQSKNRHFGADSTS